MLLYYLYVHSRTAALTIAETVVDICKHVNVPVNHPFVKSLLLFPFLLCRSRSKIRSGFAAIRLYRAKVGTR